MGRAELSARGEGCGLGHESQLCHWLCNSCLLSPGKGHLPRRTRREKQNASHRALASVFGILKWCRGMETKWGEWTAESRTRSWGKFWRDTRKPRGALKQLAASQWPLFLPLILWTGRIRQLLGEKRSCLPDEKTRRENQPWGQEVWAKLRYPIRDTFLFPSYQ